MRPNQRKCGDKDQKKKKTGQKLCTLIWNKYLLNWEKNPFKTTFLIFTDRPVVVSRAALCHRQTQWEQSFLLVGLLHSCLKTKQQTISIKIRHQDSYCTIWNKEGETNTKSERALVSREVYLYLVGETSDVYAACVQQCGRFLRLFPSSKHAALPLHSPPSHTVPAHGNNKHRVNTDVPWGGWGFTVCKSQERKQRLPSSSTSSGYQLNA